MTQVDGRLLASFVKPQQPQRSRLETLALGTQLNQRNTQIAQRERHLDMQADDSDKALLITALGMSKTAEDVRAALHHLKPERSVDENDMAFFRQLEQNKLLGGLREEPPADFTLSPGQTRFDGQGQQIASVPQQPEQPEDPTALRNNYLKVTDEFQAIDSSWGKILAASSVASPASDMSLIYNWLKVQDPTSVVRETEFEAAARAGSYGDAVRTYVEQASSGTLPEERRRDFVSSAQRTYQAALQQYTHLTEDFRNKARIHGVNPDMVIVNRQTPRQEPVFQQQQPIDVAVEGDIIRNQQGQTLILQGGRWVPYNG